MTSNHNKPKQSIKLSEKCLITSATTRENLLGLVKEGRVDFTVNELFSKLVSTLVLDRSELKTILIDIEGVTTARPLTYNSDDVGEPPPLTDVTILQKPLTYIADDVGEPRALAPNQLLLGHKAIRRTVEPLPPVAATQASRDELLAMDRARQAQVLEWWRQWQDYLQELSNFKVNRRMSSREDPARRGGSHSRGPCETHQVEDGSGDRTQPRQGRSRTTRATLHRQWKSFRQTSTATASNRGRGGRWRHRAARSAAPVSRFSRSIPVRNRTVIPSKSQS